MQVDTRAVARSLELYQLACDPYLSGLFPERESEAKAVLEMLSSVTFVIVSGAYFDARTIESQALLAVLDAELAAGDLPVLLQKVLDISCQTFQASVGAILLHEPETTQLKIPSSVGFDAPLPEDFRVEMVLASPGRSLRPASRT